jgi:hypothetical protein
MLISTAHWFNAVTHHAKVSDIRVMAAVQICLMISRV